MSLQPWKALYARKQFEGLAGLAGSQKAADSTADSGLHCLIEAVRICTQQRLAVLSERKLRLSYRCPIIIGDAEDASMTEVDDQVCSRDIAGSMHDVAYNIVFTYMHDIQVWQSC